MMNPVVFFEMPYRNHERAAKFYEAAFGWKPEMLGPEKGNYVRMQTADASAKATGSKGKAAAGAINGGMYATRPDGPAQYPAIVISVEDIKAAIARVNAAGGQVFGDGMEIPGVGFMAVFRDTEGNVNRMMQYTR
jgi:uncharacterized protein